jgi:hypothetical protein
MEQTPFSSQLHKKKSSKAVKIIPWVGLGLFVVVAALGGYLFVSKQLTLTLGNNSTSSRAAAICGDAIIGQYNAAMNYQVRSTGADPTLDTKSLGELEAGIPAKAGYADDPTCQTILFWIAVQNNDGTKAQTALTALNKLHDEGKYVDSNLANNAPLSTFKDALNNLTPNTQG